jgi:hypothetical protein
MSDAIGDGDVSTPSLPFLIGLVQQERDKQRAHFDSLDGKAGITLGFAGLLVTLAPGLPLGYTVLVVVAASAAAALSGAFEERVAR